MAQKILIIAGSSRRAGDTRFWVDHLFKTVSHETVDLLDYTISPYSYLNDYPEEDNFQALIAEILTYDTLVFATPVYWYSMSGYMKTMFDRFTDLVTVKKDVGRALKGKSVFLVAVGADADLPPGFEVPFQLTSDYLGWRYHQCLYVSTKQPIAVDEKKKEAFMAGVSAQEM